MMDRKKERKCRILHGAFGKIVTGQILLIVCCVFYLIWWSISYRPGVSVNRAGGLNGILLLITAVCGLSGVFVSIGGANAISKTEDLKLTGIQITIGGIIAYVILLLVTRYAFQRQVTTELVLITGWAMLELLVISSLNGASKLTDGRFWILVFVIAAAFAVSMVLYVLYYRMEEMKAFYAAMVPLITEGLSMAVILLVTLTSRIR